MREKQFQVIGITPTSHEELAPLARDGLTLLADPSHDSFKRFGAYKGDPLHATIVLDAAGGVVWKKVGDTPFMDVDAVVRAATARPTIELEVRNTPTPDDDYLTWAAAPCRIRQVGGAAPLVVTLTNDSPDAIPQGGDVAFAATLRPGTAATADSLAVTLPASGEWVPFFLAGKKA